MSPLAFPSRMTINQIISTITGKIICEDPTFDSDATAFKYINDEPLITLGNKLAELGYNETGEQVMFDGQTGEQIKYPGEFYVVENRPRPVGWEGSDLDFDYDTFDIDEAFSDVERLEKIGTGKIGDVKKVEQRAKGRKMVYDSPYEDVSNRFPDPDVPDCRGHPEPRPV
jgi:hypothetical protein